jgi:hypothetical protein
LKAKAIPFLTEVVKPEGKCAEVELEAKAKNNAAFHLYYLIATKPSLTGTQDHQDLSLASPFLLLYREQQSSSSKHLQFLRNMFGLLKIGIDECHSQMNRIFAKKELCRYEVEPIDKVHSFLTGNRRQGARIRKCHD